MTVKFKADFKARYCGGMFYGNSPPSPHLQYIWGYIYIDELTFYSQTMFYIGSTCILLKV